MKVISVLPNLNFIGWNEPLRTKPEQAKLSFVLNLGYVSLQKNYFVQNLSARKSLSNNLKVLYIESNLLLSANVL